MIHLADETLVAYLDGELQHPQVTWVEAELQRNAEARKRLDAFRRVSMLAIGVHRMASVPKTQDVEPAAAVPRISRPSSLTRYAFALAATVALVLIGWNRVAPVSDIRVADAGKAVVGFDALNAAPATDASDMVIATWLIERQGDSVSFIHAAPYK